MARVLFLNGPASGHVNPTLGLVEELIAQGEEVVYVCSEEYRTPLERLGATFVAYDNFLAKAEPSQLGSFMPLVLLILSSYEIIVPCILQLAEKTTFDYVIHDSMYGCGPLVASLLKVPHISTCTSFAFSERLQAGEAQPGQAFKDCFQYMREFSSLSRRMKQKYGLASRLQPQDVFFNRGDMQLLFTSRELQPEADALDSSYRFIGPCIHDRGETADFTVQAAPGEKTVYLSLGTVFHTDRDFYAMCFEALHDFAGRVIVSIGPSLDIASFGKLPDHFLVRPYIPQLLVLKHADLFITHGGMNSVHEALTFNVPLIVVPMAADQPIVARRISDLGAGRVMNRSSLTADQIRACVEDVLNTAAYRQNSARIGASLREAGGQRTAIREIVNFKIRFGIRD